MTAPLLEYLQLDDIRMRLASQGQGPLVLFSHGWPESWYSWRHQLAAVAAAGYRAVAPDMRGYGGTDAPQEPAKYSLLHLAPWRGAPIRQPSVFIAGARDGDLRFPASSVQIDRYASTLPGLRGCHILEGAGHWIQRERSATVSALLLEFLRGL